MKTMTVLSLTALLVAGCASDPNKQLKESTAQQADATRAQQEAQIDQAKSRQEKRVEDIKSDTENLPAASQQRAKAQSDMTVERQKFELDARARLAKVQARTEAAREKLQIAGGDAPTWLQDLLNQTSQLANDVSDQLGHASRLSNDRWSSEKTLIEDQLRNLEQSADKLSSRVDSDRK
jgi:uncharacterized protein YcfL